MSTNDHFQNYLESATKQFAYYQMLGTKTLERLDEKSMHWRYNDASNSAATLVKHLHGNMLSRWTNFLTEDGEKTWRDRDGEFETADESRDQIMKWWATGWKTVFEALVSVTSDHYTDLVYIRNQGHTIMDAVNRQLCHYAYHVGQIVMIGKMIEADRWESLGIPKGNSKGYNTAKFEKPKEKGHFTDEYLK